MEFIPYNYNKNKEEILYMWLKQQKDEIHMATEDEILSAEFDNKRIKG